MSLKRVLCVTAVLVLIALVAGFASHRTKDPDAPRALSGTVTDEHARPLPEAAVQMEDEKTLAVRSSITNAHGEFHFAELSPDADYDLQAVFDGIRGPKKTVSQFDSRRNATVKLTIHLPELKHQ
jgi:hypothetical protein